MFSEYVAGALAAAAPQHPGPSYSFGDLCSQTKVETSKYMFSFCLLTRTWPSQLKERLDFNGVTSIQPCLDWTRVITNSGLLLGLGGGVEGGGSPSGVNGSGSTGKGDGGGGPSGVHGSGSADDGVAGGGAHGCRAVGVTGKTAATGSADDDATWSTSAKRGRFDADADTAANPSSSCATSTSHSG